MSTELFCACVYLGKQLSIEIQAPQNNDITIKNICEQSNIAYREVRLSRGWSQKNHGPLLAYQQNKPVVLLWENNCYTIVYPKTKEKVLLHKADLPFFKSTAYMFYPSTTNPILQKKTVLHLIFCSLAASLLSLCIPISYSWLFNDVVPFFDEKLLLQVALGVSLSILFATLFSCIQSLIIVQIKTENIHQLHTALWNKLLSLPLPFFQQYNSGELLQRAFSIHHIDSLLSARSLSSLISGCFSILYLAVMLFYSWKLTLIACSLLALAVTISLFLTHRKLRTDTKILEEKGQINGFILQALEGIHKIRTMGAETFIFQKWAQRFSKLILLEIKSRHLQNGMNLITQTLPILGLFAFFAFNHPLPVGNFLAFYTAYALFISACFHIINTYSYILSTLSPEWKHAQSIFHAPQESLSHDQHLLQGALSIDHVSFRYNKNSAYLLKNYSLTANPGQCIGITGPSGSGKSTLIRLLLGFEACETGSILFDGYNIKDLNIQSLRQQLGVVLQDSNLLPGTIEENLSYGGLYSTEKIMHALSLVGFEEDLSNLPMGIYTFLLDGASTLSSGQKQRLLIARALVNQPKILLLDEATSSLDQHSHSLLHTQLASLKITRILISHRPSTLAFADHIYQI